MPTKKSFCKEEKYLFELDGEKYSAMFIAEKMFKSKGWSYPTNMVYTWERTCKSKGKYGNRGTFRMRRKKGSGFSGRGGYSYGVSVSVGTKCHIGKLLELILHELCHVDQNTGDKPKKNNRRRPHDYNFNLKMLRFAKRWWGYPSSCPISNGWSVGKGYEPSRQLRIWLITQLDENTEKKAKILKWLKSTKV